jgi:hypothetical protein
MLSAAVMHATHGSQSMLLAAATGMSAEILDDHSAAWQAEP